MDRSCVSTYTENFSRRTRGLMKRNDLQEGKRHYDSQYLIGARREAAERQTSFLPSCAQQCYWEALRRLHFRCNARLCSDTRRDASGKLIIVRAVLWNYLLRQIHIEFSSIEETQIKIFL